VSEDMLNANGSWRDIGEALALQWLQKGSALSIPGGVRW